MLNLHFCGISTKDTNPELNQEGHSTKSLNSILWKCQGYERQIKMEELSQIGGDQGE